MILLLSRGLYEEYTVMTGKLFANYIFAYGVKYQRNRGSDK